MFRVLTILLIGWLLVACRGEKNVDPAGELDAAVAAIESLPSVSQVVEITESNDPHDLFGRSEGVVASAVFYDSRLRCATVSLECGAVVEVMSDPAEAKARSASVKALQQGMSMLGFEHHFLNGAILLRVDGALSAKQAAAYEAALAS